MTRMKTRCTIIRNLASSEAKGAVFSILLLLLAFAIPRLDYAQDKVGSAKITQPQPGPAVPAINAGTAASAKNAAAGNAAVTLQAGAITDVKVAPEEGKLTVAVTTDRSIEPMELILDNPPRLVLDFPNTENKVKFSRLPVLSPSVKQVRVQQFQSSPSPIARVVCDLQDDYGTHEVNLDKSLVRLVFHKETPKPLPATAGPVVKPAPPSPAAVTPDRVRTQPEAPKAAAAVSEPKPPSTGPVVKSPVAPAPAATAAQPDRAHPQAELPKTVVAPAEPKPRPAAPAAKQSMDTAPLVAALMPTAISTPPKMVSSANSRFSGQPLTLDLINMPLVDFFRLMSEEAGINIVPDPDVKGSYTIKGEKIPWDQVFEMALVSNGLDKQVEGNIIRITRKATLQDEAKQREALKRANLLAADLETRIKRLNYAKAQDLAKALGDQKTVRGTIVIDDRTNSLILTDISSSLDRLTGLIESLDIAQPQVEIEARIVSATRNFARDIGIQFGFVDGNLQRVTVGGPNTFGTIGGTRPSATCASIPSQAK